MTSPITLLFSDEMTEAVLEGRKVLTQHKDLLARLQEVEAERQRILTEFKRARA